MKENAYKSLAEKTRGISNRAKREQNKEKRLEAAKEAKRQKRISTLVGFADEIADLFFNEAKNMTGVFVNDFDELQNTIESYAKSHPESKCYDIQIQFKVGPYASDPYRYIYEQVNEYYKYTYADTTVNAVKLALTNKFSKLVAWCQDSGYAIDFKNLWHYKPANELSVVIKINWY